MREFLAYSVRALVGYPEAIGVGEVEGSCASVYELRVGEGDPRKVIGKAGQTARAIRTPLSAALARLGVRAVLEILE